MRISVGATALVSALALSSTAAIASPLTGKMARMASLPGTVWTCATNVLAMGNQPAMTDQAQVTFESVGGNVLHVRIASPVYAADQYFGYNDASGKWWTTSADNMGETSSGTSTDGRVYTGTMEGRHQGPFTSTFSMVSANRETIQEVEGTLPSAVTMDTVCTR